jgi:hypothetical protein
MTNGSFGARFLLVDTLEQERAARMFRAALTLENRVKLHASME